MDTLPDELLCETINQLFLVDVKDVWNIGLANRRLHRIAKELLYSSYSLNGTDPGLFIRALASSPNLERCVQRVTWGYGDHAFKFPEVLTTAELRHISERVGFGRVERREVAGKKRTRELNVWLADHGKEEYINVFMLFALEVKTVVIVPNAWDRKVVWFKPALDSQMFSNLQEAHVDGVIRIGNVLSLFLLPLMRTLTLSHVGIHRDTDGVGSRHEWEATNAFWKRLEREGSSLENLILPTVGSDTLDLVRVLESFQGLKKIEFAFSGHGLGKDDVNVRTLLRAIAHHHGSLISLNIDDGRLEKDPNALEELRTLDHLERLQMLTPVFYSGSRDERKDLAEKLPRRFKDLPRHLKHLRISTLEDYCDLTEPFLDVLLTMAPTIDAIFPNLERITFFGWNPQLGTFPCQTRIAALQSGLAKAGVELESIHNTDGSAEAWYEESRVTFSTKTEEGWMWVELLHDWTGSER